MSKKSYDARKKKKNLAFRGRFKEIIPVGLGDVGKLAIMSSALSTVFVDKSLSLSGGGDKCSAFQL